MRNRLQSKDDEFYDITYRLKFLIRYSNMPRNHDESVAEHSFFVCMILMNLHDKYEFDLGHALQMAVCHDVAEAYTNDISHQTKSMFPEIKDILHKIEMKLAKKFPLTVRNAIEDYLKDSVEADFVKYADATQCYQYARAEVAAGATGYMKEVINNSKARMNVLKKELEPYERSRNQSY